MQWDESSLSHTDVMLDLPAKHTESKEKIGVKEGNFGGINRGSGKVDERGYGVGNRGIDHGNTGNMKENEKEAKEKGIMSQSKNGMLNEITSTCTVQEIGSGTGTGRGVLGGVGTEAKVGLGLNFVDSHTDYTNKGEKEEKRHENILLEEKITMEIPTPRCLVIAVSTNIIDIMNTYRIRNNKRRTSVSSDTDKEENKSSKELSPESSTFFRKFLDEEDSNISIMTLKKLSKLSNLPKIRENLDFLSASLPILNVKSNSPDPNSSHGHQFEEEEDEI